MTSKGGRKMHTPPPLFVYPIPKCSHKKTVRRFLLLFCYTIVHTYCLSLLEVEEHFDYDILFKPLRIKRTKTIIYFQNLKLKGQQNFRNRRFDVIIISLHIYCEGKN